jgi:LacI family transcriptional regulator
MTVRDVAKQAGVSIATVSRVLNGKGKISEEAKQAVEQAIDILNYQKPPPKKKKPTKLFAVIVRNMTNPFFSQVIDLLEEEAYKHGRSLLLFNSRNNLHLEKTFLSECENHHVDGVFLIPRSLKEEHIQPLTQLPFPVVVLTTTTPFLPSVGTHHQHGGKLAANHLLSQGHRNIGYIGMSSPNSDRFIGFQQQLAKRGINLAPESVLNPYDEHSLHQFITQQLIEHPSPISAIFCSDDIAASHLLMSIQQRIPSLLQHLDVIGFDDTFIAHSMGFSSIKQPIKRIALHGFDLMMSALECHTESTSTLLEPELIVRHCAQFNIHNRQPEII